jgi:hypothetical protein
VPDELAVSFSEDEDLVWGNEVIFLVNDTPLHELVQSGVEDGWIGPPIGVLTSQPDHLLGGPDRWEDGKNPWYDDPALLACTCGQPRCRAVLAHIEVDDTVVRWSQFRRGHADDFVNLGLGPYTFARTAYEALIREISRRANANRT